MKASARSAALMRYAREVSRVVVLGRALPDRMTQVRAAYRAALDRDADEVGLRFYLSEIAQGTLNVRGVLRALMDSTEFRQRHGLPLAYPPHLDALHQSRRELIERYLPPAKSIVDVGGASSRSAQGALLEMGYPHPASDVTIVDFPPADRIGVGSPVVPPAALTTVGGTTVRYLYRPMTDLSPIRDGSVDLVYSGESIEHITEDEADQVCRETLRVLRPGGYFCLDTPNALLTRLQSPNALIHPEHKKEYEVAELRAKLSRWGFEIEMSMAVCPMAESRRTGVFRAEEMLANVGVSEVADDGYLFYLQARKPGG